MKYLIVYPESHNHLGIFADLNDIPEVYLYVAEQRVPHSGFSKLVKKVHTSGMIAQYVNLPLKRLWYKRIEFNIQENENYCVIIVDAALKAFKVSELNNLFARKNVRGVLCLINSINAHSTSMYEIKSTIPKVKWEYIYSFDPQDMMRYGFKSIEGAYYSKKDPEHIKALYTAQFKSPMDVYFTGGLKGNREKLVVDTFELLRKNDIKADFNILVAGNERLKNHSFADSIRYYSGKWIPYEEVLAGVLNSKVIVEILQDGQCGPSLRYYEAVCYNKKLLTTNEFIKGLPFYNPNYMRVFHSPEDIDVEWIKKDEKVDYCYNDEFSPKRLLEVVRK